MKKTLKNQTRIKREKKKNEIRTLGQKCTKVIIDFFLTSTKLTGKCLIGTGLGFNVD